MEPTGTVINGVTFVNLTPHPINAIANDGTRWNIPASGRIARAEQSSAVLPEPVAGIFAVSRTSYGKVIDLPEPEDGFVYIVSSLTAQAAAGRNDVLIPGPAVRDDAGNIVACQGFCQI